MENKIIKFHETELITLIDDAGTPFVAVKPICDAIGLNADSAVRGIKKHPILGPEHTVQSVQVGENQKRDYLTLPIQYINGWLFSIDLKKVKPEAQEKLLMYQKECYQVLFNFFFGVSANVVSRQKQRFELLQEIKSIESQISHFSLRKKEVYKQLDGIDTDIFIQLELFPPNQIENN